MKRTERNSHGKESQTERSAGLQGTLAEHAQGGIVGDAILVQAVGEHQDQSDAASKRVQEIRHRVHLLPVEFRRNQTEITGCRDLVRYELATGCLEYRNRIRICIGIYKPWI